MESFSTRVPVTFEAIEQKIAYVLMDDIETLARDVCSHLERECRLIE